jgi:hypothetical protein
VHCNNFSQLDEAHALIRSLNEEAQVILECEAAIKSNDPKQLEKAMAHESKWASLAIIGKVREVLSFASEVNQVSETLVEVIASKNVVKLEATIKE